MHGHDGDFSLNMHDLDNIFVNKNMVCFYCVKTVFHSLIYTSEQAKFLWRKLLHLCNTGLVYCANTQYKPWAREV
jgi:predicted membrane channel-forming protein YqfA (hemolysin III family)